MDPVQFAQDIDDACNVECHALEYPELCKNVITDLFNFKILTFNIRSMNHNFDDFLITLGRLNIKFDILILTECWLDDNSNIDTLDGYNSYRTQKFINQAGGVVAFVKSELNPIVCEPDLDDANCLRIDIPNHLSILGIYRGLPPYKYFSRPSGQRECLYRREYSKSQYLAPKPLLPTDTMRFLCHLYTTK
ncbi:hypothetical protein ABMA28_007414 [Loxostege sticticalis]|uniref:Uncharacterized protein n=1 Tax=Loxostege sticticalis TaxID=481309 RepID=A0ABD0TQL3_LOXSC